MREVPAEKHNAELIKWLKANGATQYDDDVRRLSGKRVLPCTREEWEDCDGSTFVVMTTSRWPKWLREHHANQEAAT